MFSFLHAADIHLDSPLKGLEGYQDAPMEQIRLAARRAFDNLVQLAVDEKVAFLLIAGDLYDGDWKDYNTGIYFINRMGRLRDAGIPVFMVSGNHDAVSQITRSLQLPANITHFSHRHAGTHILDHYGVAIHGQSFSGRPLAVRLVLEGITPIHTQLHENRVQLNEEFRAIAANLGDLWIEKVMVNTRKREEHCTAFAADSPLISLIQSIERVKLDASSIVELVPEFEKLRSKLPPELLSEGDPFRPDEEELSTLRQEVEELLMGKIKQRGQHEN